MKVAATFSSVKLSGQIGMLEVRRTVRNERNDPLEQVFCGSGRIVPASQCISCMDNCGAMHLFIFALPTYTALPCTYSLLNARQLVLYVHACDVDPRHGHSSDAYFVAADAPGIRV